MANTALNRTGVLLATNKSGGALTQGATVILSSGTANAFTTTTSANYEDDQVFVILEPNGIANDAVGLIANVGYVPKINLASSASLGDYTYTHTVAGQAQRSGTKSAGAFGQVLGTGTSPAAILFGGLPKQTGSSGAPDSATYWVEDADGTLSAEKVVGSIGITQTVYGSRQAAAKAGRLHFPTDGFSLGRDDGSNWDLYGPVYPLTEPSTSGFAWTNQGSASATATKGGLYITTPGTASATSLRIYTKTAPSVPYTITVALLPLFGHSVAGAFSLGCGLTFRESSSGKLHQFGLESVANGASSSLQMQSRKWTDATTFSASYASIQVMGWPVCPMWLRIADDNTNRICSYSPDGQNWITFHSVGRTDFLTADQVGFFLRCDGSTTPITSMTVLSWLAA